jgi:proteasome lid subunit RPN8/RPN11
MSLPRPYRFSTAEWSRLRDRSFLTQQLGHLDVCGVFGITRKNEIRLYFIPNRTKQRYAFAIHRCDVIRIEKFAAKSSIQVSGTFHSHPIGEAVLSPNDDAKGFYRNHQMM